MSTTETDLVPIEKDLGDKLVALAAKAPNVVIAETDPESAMLAIVSRILDSETTEDMNAVFSGEGRYSSDTLADSGETVTLRQMTIRPSDNVRPDGTRGRYASFDAVNSDGEAIVVNSGSKAVIAQFLNADARGLTPVTGRFVRAEDPTQAGYHPIHFEFE